MEPDNKKNCVVHQKNEAVIVCVNPQCNGYRICCPQCLSDQLHKGHKVISYSEYKKIRQNLSKIQPYFKEDICGKILETKKKIESSLNNFYESILQNFMTYDLCLKQAGQQQQQLGQIQILCRDPLFRQALQNNDNIHLKKILQKTSMFLLEKLIDLQQQLLINIDKKYEQINIYSNNGSSVSKSKMGIDSYLFKKGDGHPLIGVSQDGKTAFRIQKNKYYEFSSNDYFGLTVHHLVHSPLSKQQGEISFMIKKQPFQRFIYFGLCELDKFKYQGFMRGYQMGGGMIGIRQNIHKGKSAFCLHDFDSQFSNKQIVKWDFDIGDKITIRLNFLKSSVEFYKNNKENFQMPINTKISYFPFIGLKFAGDAVSIVE